MGDAEFLHLQNMQTVANWEGLCFYIVEGWGSPLAWIEDERPTHLLEVLGIKYLPHVASVRDFIVVKLLSDRSMNSGY